MMWMHYVDGGWEFWLYEGRNYLTHLSVRKQTYGGCTCIARYELSVDILRNIDGNLIIWILRMTDKRFCFLVCSKEDQFRSLRILAFNMLYEYDKSNQYFHNPWLYQMQKIIYFFIKLKIQRIYSILGNVMNTQCYLLTSSSFEIRPSLCTVTVKVESSFPMYCADSIQKWAVDEQDGRSRRKIYS